jgi:hypothetical protein
MRTGSKMSSLNQSLICKVIPHFEDYLDAAPIWPVIWTRTESFKGTDFLPHSGICVMAYSRIDNDVAYSAIFMSSDSGPEEVFIQTSEAIGSVKKSVGIALMSNDHGFHFEVKGFDCPIEEMMF